MVLKKGMICLYLTVFFFTMHVNPFLFAATLEQSAGKYIKQETKVPVITKSIITEKKQSSVKGKVPKVFPHVRRKTAGKSYAAPRKDPRLACLLSLVVPGGGGQIYLRKDLKGIGFCLLTGTGYTLTAYFTYHFLAGPGKDTSLKTRIIIPGMLLMVSMIFHIVGVVEAYNDAEEINNEDLYYGIIRRTDPYSAKIISESLSLN